MDMTTESIQPRSAWNLFIKGAIAMMPLSIAVLPWGILAGSYALDSGLSPLQGQALSAIMFAGSAQLVSIGMFSAGAGLLSLLITIVFITSRHLLYSMSMRDRISPLPLRWRVVLGFLLTDELFAVMNQREQKAFNRWYALGAGLSFYLIWNLATLAGLIAGHMIPDLNSLGLDFAIAATFIAIVIPQVTSLPVFVTVFVALLMSIVLNAFQVEGSLVIASLCAMVAGYTTDRCRGGC
ncbi:Inner membrane protein YgaZ [Vibrio aerogenes CECT 7868]|uniref:Inner membrane protein YgaZ n=1 Tax=Vibrio aerogenes CECT 7868 TaxID=1216006 RepID=A0A1M5ZW86_9VIBR|nr:AzlC family ABC transporter permease [Vibrio aerogenes]SHI28514.1 Inner membrane protein YgaZ [Vibrio aerogenes CECT 7868]